MDSRHAGKIALLVAVISGVLGLVGVAAAVALPKWLADDEVEPAKLFHIQTMTDPERFTFGMPKEAGSFNTVNSFLFPPGKLRSLEKPGEYCYAWHEWAHRNGGVDIDRTSIAVNIAALTDAPVQVLGAKLNTKPVQSPPAGDQAACDQGDETTASYLSLNLEERTAVYLAKGNRPSALALTIARDDPERIYIQAEAGGCFCEWSLDLELMVQGKTLTHRIDNGGKPFVTAPRADYPYYLFTGAGWQRN